MALRRARPRREQVQDGRAVTTAYDEAGRRTSVGYPSGYRLDFDYEDTDLRRIRDPRGTAVELRPGGTTRFPRTRGPVIATVALELRRAARAAGHGGGPRHARRTPVPLGRVGQRQRRRGRRRARSARCLVRHGLAGPAAWIGHERGSGVEYDLDPAGNRTVVRVDGEEGRYSMGGGADRVTNRYTTTPADREPTTPTGTC